MATTTTTHEKAKAVVSVFDEREGRESFDEERTIDQNPGSHVNVGLKAEETGEGEGEDDDSDLEKEREATRAAIQEPNGAVDDFPDGGWRAWLVVFGVSSLVIELLFHFDN